MRPQRLAYGSLAAKDGGTSEKLLTVNLFDLDGILDPVRSNNIDGALRDRTEELFRPTETLGYQDHAFGHVLRLDHTELGKRLELRIRRVHTRGSKLEFE